MKALLRLARPSTAALAVVLGAATVLSGAALLATSGALITAASRRPESLFALLPMITSVRLFAVSRAGFRYAERVVSHDVTLRLVGRLRVRLLETLLPLAPAALLGVRGGELLARIRADVDELQGVFVRLAAPAAVAVLAGGASVALTAVVSPVLALLLAGLLMLSGLAVPAWARSAGGPGAQGTSRADAAFGAELLDLVRGLPDHLMADGGLTARAKITAQLERQRAAESSSAGVVAITDGLRHAVPALGVVAALWLVGWDVAYGSTHPVLLAAAALGVLGAFEAVAGLGQAWAAAGGLRAAAERVTVLAEQTPPVREREQPRPLPEGHVLRFDAVAYSYPGAGRYAVRDLNLVVCPGDKVALTGPSGTGKSTVLGLAMRFIDPDEGRVLLGDRDVRELSLNDVRSRTAWAAQAPQLLGTTIAANLRLAAPEAPDSALHAALEDVDLDEAFGERLHDWIGEAGDRLSAGERARVSVARTLLSPAPILLLDEPTAHLDRPGAGAILDRLAREDRAVLLVTHSPELLDDRWRVVEL